MTTLAPDRLRVAEAELFKRRFYPDEIPVHDRPGIYALFTNRSVVLPIIGMPASGPLYLGMTLSSLKVRNHFKHQQSGFSTLRRSLGALLKSELQLQALPRASGTLVSNTTNYRFQEEGEQRLTRWMTQHLTYGCVPLDQDVGVVERALIREFEPPLNLTGWPNPFRQTLMVLRTVCRNEAQRAPGASS